MCLYPSSCPNLERAEKKNLSIKLYRRETCRPLCMQHDGDYKETDGNAQTTKAIGNFLFMGAEFQQTKQYAVLQWVDSHSDVIIGRPALTGFIYQEEIPKGKTNTIYRIFSKDFARAFSIVWWGHLTSYWAVLEGTLSTSTQRITSVVKEFRGSLSSLIL